MTNEKKKKRERNETSEAVKEEEGEEGLWGNAIRGEQLEWAGKLESVLELELSRAGAGLQSVADGRSVLISSLQSAVTLVKISDQLDNRGTCAMFLKRSVLIAC
ncbi:hypothetical protein LSTR_LSTR010856 [Laodelphax striatellus]|uniref:Uncharacterized protein n=1 Tax=Laodelphax striatellus TaxID=195883 RepID=A0A482XDZ5_LAOST|nr:hypothetical protein LSTR_LSTR010856 [Laodelphax striatellus]